MKQIVFGRNPLNEKLKNPKDIHIVYLTQNDKELEKRLEKLKIPFKLISKNEMSKMVETDKHQGIAFEIEAYQYADLQQVLKKIPSGKVPLLLMLDGLEDPHNLGAILRSSDAVGVDAVIVGKNRSVGLNGTVAKVSTGAIDYVLVCQVTNLTRTLEQLKKEGFWVVGTAFEHSQDYRTVDYNMPLVLVIGSEGFGISTLVLKQCDFKVHIPMIGHVNSLNASNATAVLLYQIFQNRFPIN